MLLVLCKGDEVAKTADKLPVKDKADYHALSDTKCNVSRRGNLFEEDNPKDFNVIMIMKCDLCGKS